MFDSRFECGNLFMAFSQNLINYDLLIQNDINSDGHAEWFYFKVGNTTKDSIVQFNIKNFV